MVHTPAPSTGLALLSRLLRDTAGNTLMLVAAALLPLLALIGGGLDMGRGYLAQSRLQQACDAGVLAARQRLGTSAAVTGTIPDEVSELGRRFFNINYREGQYGTEERDFSMTLESDYAVSGDASVAVPTTVMRVFGFYTMDIDVTCTAQLNMSNTDVMMVLDVTGSMALTNPGDSASRLETLKDTVRSFHAQMTAAAPPATRLRFGFVPYSTNVNVGGLLEDDWMVDEWHYQSRERISTGNEISTTTYQRNWQYVSGSRDGAQQQSTYPATYHPPSGGPPVTVVGPNETVQTVGGGSGYYSCDTPPPANSYTATDTLVSTSSNVFIGPPPGTQVIETHRYTENGTRYWLELHGQTCKVMRQLYANFIQQYEKVTEPILRETHKWRYNQLSFDVSNWRYESNGCIEERSTYPITDFEDVDLTRALDLDIDLVPTTDEDTRWRPAYPWRIYTRSIYWNGAGSFTLPPKVTDDEYMMPAGAGLAACPPPARRLGSINTEQLNDYLDTLVPNGATYHDIGMIWGGRLLSPTGLFADDNADASSTNPTSRHLIFLTDGETAPLDLSYSSYGIEPLDRRRWEPSSPLSLTQTVEGRFSFACEEVKKRNITVWVISFGTAPNPVMQQCSGADRYFVADNAEELQQTFTTIAQRMGELRISR